MIHTSSAPSGSPIGDADSKRETSRPRVVIIAGCLIALSVAIAGIDAATDTGSTSNFSSKVTIFWFVVLVLLAAGFVYKLLQGRNWARVTYVVILVVGIPSLITNVREVMIAPSTFNIVFLLQSMIQFSALGLLFSPSARAWFRKR
jgi:lysylphosphatidylglycerol synthetase-like protein (DUF2156 family)